MKSRRVSVGLAVTFGMLAGCGDSDDSNPMAAEPVDANVATIDASQPRLDLGQADVGRSDLGPADLGQADQGPADMGLGDVGPTDSGTADLGDPDLGPSDVRPIDLGSPDLGSDAGPLDAGPFDAGPSDAGSTDLGSPDFGFIDTGSSDTGWDGGLSDGGMDAGVSDRGVSCKFGGDYLASSMQWFRFDLSGNWTVASSQSALGTNPNLGVWSVAGLRFTIQDSMNINCSFSVIGTYDLSYGAACEVTLTLVSDACTNRALALTSLTFTP